MPAGPTRRRLFHPVLVLLAAITAWAPPVAEAQECPIDNPRHTVVWSRFFGAVVDLYGPGQARYDIPMTAEVLGDGLGKAALQVGDDPEKRTAFACLQKGVEQKIVDLYVVLAGHALPIDSLEPITLRMQQRALEAARGFYDAEIDSLLGVAPDDTLASLFTDPDPPASPEDPDPRRPTRGCGVKTHAGNPNAPDADWSVMTEYHAGGMTHHVVQRPATHPDRGTYQEIRRRSVAWMRENNPRAGAFAHAGLAARSKNKSDVTRAARAACRGSDGGGSGTTTESPGDRTDPDLLGPPAPAEPGRVDPASAAGRITATCSDCVVLDANGRTRPACEGCTIHPGETLVTGPGEGAEILWIESAAWTDIRGPVKYEVSPDTRLEIIAARHPRLPCHDVKGCLVYTANGPTWSKEPEFASLWDGRVRAVARVGHEPGGYTIRSGPATITFDGTDFVVARDSAAGTVDVMVGEGTVTVEAGGGSTRVAAGERVTVRGGAPGAVATLGPGDYPARTAGTDPAPSRPTTGDRSGAVASGGATSGSGGGGGGGGGGVRSPGFGTGHFLLLALGLLVLGLLVALVVVRSRSARTPGVRIDLAIEVRGPGDTGPRTVRFERAPVTIGRDPSNDVVLSDPDVSRRHARIVVRDGTLHVLDESSSHGTYIDGSRVESAEIRSGTSIRLGGTTVNVA